MEPMESELELSRLYETIRLAVCANRKGKRGRRRADDWRAGVQACAAERDEMKGDRRAAEAGQLARSWMVGVDGCGWTCEGDI